MSINSFPISVYIYTMGASNHDTHPSQPLLSTPGPTLAVAAAAPHRRQRLPLVPLLLAFLLLASLIAFIINDGFKTPSPEPEAQMGLGDVSRAKEQGVSEKRFRVGSDDGNGSFEWTAAMLTWQRTAYHFQPLKNWMNDPDGPLYHMGWYHLFYQYNPDSAVWGNITWGHAVSRDLIHWLDLPLAMVPDTWYDFNGVWTGSATILPGGDIVMLYTGDTNNYVQVQCLAYPANLSDPLLLDWVKYPDNPVMTPPEGIALKDFRDPTTMWVGPDGIWRLIIGSKINGTGVALVYKTSNFTSYELVEDHVLHAVRGTGMWECVDFYPVSTTSQRGLDTSSNGPGIKHVLKESADDNKHDWYAIGTYDDVNDTWTPDDPLMDVGIGLRVDYGKYYASKTFYDSVKERRVLWGWVGETDSEDADLEKGWSSIQTIPRVVTFDNKTGSNILEWPVEEVESLRSSSYEFTDILVEPGSVVNLDIGNATQLDISVEFVIDGDALNTTTGSTTNCSTASTRGALGPFGLLVLTDDTLSELTPVYFYVSKSTDGGISNWFCTDKSRSTKAPDVDVQVYGSLVPVLDDENYTMRLLVDHSVVEAFGQGGRSCITSRVYPTKAIYGDAKLFLFNNATHLNVTASLKVWQMESAHIHPFPFDAQI